MKETGILFTPENIRLVRNKLKWQTRRVCAAHGEGLHYGKKLNEWDLSSPPFQVEEDHLPLWRWQGKSPAQIGYWVQEIQSEVDDNVTLPIRNPYGVPCDLLYIKEGVIVRGSNKTLVGYYMNGARPLPPYDKRLTAMFMAKRYARTWLELTDVRVERLQDISEEDAIAEGIKEKHVIVGSNCNGGIHHEESAMRYFYAGGEDEGYESASEAYRHLWDSINGNAHPWESNPFVWRLSFRLI